MPHRLLDDVRGDDYPPSVRSRIRAFALRLSVLVATALIVGPILILVGGPPWGLRAVIVVIMAVCLILGFLALQAQELEMLQRGEDLEHSPSLGHGSVVANPEGAAPWPKPEVQQRWKYTHRRFLSTSIAAGTTAVLVGTIVLISSAANDSKEVSSAPTGTRPSPTPLSTSSDHPVVAALPYTADWTTNLSGWIGTESWLVSRGALVSNGEDYGTEVGVTAPLDLTGVVNYAVEANIRLLRYQDSGAISGLASFGIAVRIEGNGDNAGYRAGVCASAGIFSCGSGSDPGRSSQAVLWLADNGDNAVLDAIPFEAGSDWHRYRVEVRGDHIRLMIDGMQVLEAVDNMYLSGDRVGLWSDRSQIEVSSFAVASLQS